MIRHGTAQTSAANIQFAALPPLVPDIGMDVESAFVPVLPIAKTRAERAMAAIITACPTTSVGDSATADITHNTKSP
jgi:hypothetical protein